MSLAVVDACVLVAFYASDDPRRAAVSVRLTAGHALFAPAHLDAEVVSASRGMARGKPVLTRAVPAALRRQVERRERYSMLLRSDRVISDAARLPIGYRSAQPGALSLGTPPGRGPVRDRGAAAGVGSPAVGAPGAVGLAGCGDDQASGLGRVGEPAVIDDERGQPFAEQQR